jgi:hypothetical protein
VGSALVALSGKFGRAMATPSIRRVEAAALAPTLMAMSSFAYIVAVVALGTLLGFMLFQQG